METLIIYLQSSLSFPRFKVVLGKDKIVISLLTKYLNLKSVFRKIRGVDDFFLFVNLTAGFSFYL